jgi:glucan phosphoethanolaminetransferase (alkaline phosphatase superfamily)
VKLAQKIAEIAGSSTGHFIWVIKYGIHFPYSRALPRSAVEWQPADFSDRIDPARKAELANLYDSALKFNLERFFKALDIENWRNRNVLVYTSDHGQTLSENGERHTHCGTTATTSITEAMVPLFIVVREPMTPDVGYRASHANIFPTFLDFMQFPSNERRDFYAPSLLNVKAVDSQPRQFWVGDPSERILGARFRFDQ